MKAIKTFFTLCATIICVTLFSQNAAAQDNFEHYAHVSVVPEKQNVTPGETIKLATIIDLADHWHVYWRNPGDSGLPVDIQWTAPKGFEIGDITWPVPDKIVYDILANYGYFKRVVFTQDLTIPANMPAGKIELKEKINLLVCNEICVPESYTIPITLNDPAAPQANNDALFQTEAKEKLPQKLTGDFSFSSNKKNLIIRLENVDTKSLKIGKNDTLEFFPRDYGIIMHAQAPTFSYDENSISLTQARGDQPLDDFDVLPGLLVIRKNGDKSSAGYAITLKANGKSLKNSASAAAPQTPENKTPLPKIKTANMTTLTALLFAFLGGLVLNLMPCVFPVLSMKALSLVKMKGKEIALARKHGLAYTGGVVLSFLAVGGMLLLLKDAGESIGWGFQLQNPMVIGLLAYVLFTIGLNLIGLFDIGTNMGNVGQKLTQGQGLSQSFFTGILATVVATPCTAPFMGAALGFAIIQPAPIALGIFTALGLGLATPYLVLSCVPATQKILPKPGAWMNTFKQFLAFPMFASAIWLVWVLDQQSGAFGIFLVLMGMLSIAFCVWLTHHKTSGILKAVNMLVLVICVLIPPISLTYLKTVETAPQIIEKSMEHLSKPFSYSALDDALSSDDPVFVEMTAAWCITCKFNHAVALNVQSTKKLFTEKNIRYLIGDWTNNDQEITNYLSEFDRNGVPLYVFYGKRDPQTGKRPEPKILPQVLTPGLVQDYVTK